MVSDAYGMDGQDIQTGVKALINTALDATFRQATGQYFDNDRGGFAAPHLDAIDSAKCAQLVEMLDAILASLQSGTDIADEAITATG